MSVLTILKFMHNIMKFMSEFQIGNVGFYQCSESSAVQCIMDNTKARPSRLQHRMECKNRVRVYFGFVRTEE